MLALLLLATVAVAQYQYPTTCESPRLNKCLTDVFGDGEYGLGVSTDTATLQRILKDYTILNNWFLSQWGRDDGIDTIVKNCNGLTNLYHCLGGPVCFSMKNMLQDQGISKEDAYAVRGVLAEYGFNCGAGLGTMLSGNIKCIQNAISSSQDYLKGCTATYLNNVLHDEPRACSYANQLALCYMTPFHLSECRTEQDSDTWWACNSQREFVAPQFGYCYNEMACTEQPLGAFLEQHHTVNADGSHTLRLPDLVQKSEKEGFKTVRGKEFTIRL
ncbi:hypothetical protein PENTCL1PPCAC_24960 [Pristionchus entomophagus]|uniref:Secreted protein n=1 Tax=Pristionchus entomophagus TaxID=358040 RepID=A0AAV5U7B9_9BILA|nr:hypothetical protein PENTCL1PPCAC_24960 [Pristionchus entomophagus]